MIQERGSGDMSNAQNKATDQFRETASMAREDLREMVIDTLTDSRTRQRGYFNQRAVSAILRAVSASPNHPSPIGIASQQRGFYRSQPRPVWSGACCAPISSARQRAKTH